MALFVYAYDCIFKAHDPPGERRTQPNRQVQVEHIEKKNWNLSLPPFLSLVEHTFYKALITFQALKEYDWLRELWEGLIGQLRVVLVRLWVC